ncbi:MAG: MFS transporter [Betaproteobacteria bacterium]|nr:MFS transporter [Betaproteobacteria bacterium]NBY04901.1 MFS transporter [Betaproteobacteria bacterium]
MKFLIPIPRWLSAYGTRFLPFADAATPELPMARLLRLSLFQVVIGMVTALLVGTLNRVMIVELQVSAWWVALAVAIPMVFAPLRTLIGYRSDTHPSALGLRRIPFMWTGTLLLFGGLSIMPFALLLLSEPESAHAWMGQIGAFLAFVMVGAGIQVTQTAGMALAHDLATPEKRPRVVALLYSMLLVGMMASSTLFGLFLDNFSAQKLIQMVQGCAVMVAALNLMSLWKQEARQTKRGRRQAGGFSQSWRALMTQPHMRRFLWTLGLGTFAFNMQDIVLEPYAAEILHLDVGMTSALTAMSAGGALLAFMLSARCLAAGVHACRLASLGVLLGLPAFAMVIFSGPLQAAWLFRTGVFLIGMSGGLFSVGMLVSAMGLGHAMDGGRLGGLVVGTWGAVQATSAGAAMALGGALRDGISVLAMSGAMGEALTSPITAYSFVYHLEIYLLFVVLVALGPMLRNSRLSASATGNTASTPFGLAQLPG